MYERLMSETRRESRALRLRVVRLVDIVPVCSPADGLMSASQSAARPAKLPTARTAAPSRSTAARSGSNSQRAKGNPVLVAAAVGALLVAALAAFVFWPRSAATQSGAIATLQTLDYHALALSPTDAHAVSSA